MRKCKYCDSEFVCWNWIYCRTFKTWWSNLIRGIACAWKKPWIFITQRHGHECWNCNRLFFTIFRITDGISYNSLKRDFVHLPRHDMIEHVESLWRLLACKHLDLNEKYRYDKEVYKTLEEISETLQKQWNLEHQLEE